MRTATAWSGTCDRSARADVPPISTKQRLSGEPIRSMPPRASWRSSVHVEQPVLEARRTEIGYQDLHVRLSVESFQEVTTDLRQISLHQSFGRTRNDVAGDQFADLRGRGGAGFDGRTHAADVAADDGRDQSAADLQRA